MDLGEFVGVRARMQRLADAKCFNAWVVDIDEESAVVEALSPVGFEVGQKFLLQVSGLKSAITCQTELRGIEGNELRFVVSTPVTAGHPYEAARFRQSLDGFIEVDGRIVPVRIGDVSSGGLGIFVEEELPVWKTVYVIVQAATGCVRVEGQVRYCREVDDDPWQYRVGLFAPEMEEHLDRFNVGQSHIEAR